MIRANLSTIFYTHVECSHTMQLCKALFEAEPFLHEHTHSLSVSLSHTHTHIHSHRAFYGNGYFISKILLNTPWMLDFQRQQRQPLLHDIVWSQGHSWEWVVHSNCLDKLGMVQHCSNH